LRPGFIFKHVLTASDTVRIIEQIGNNPTGQALLPAELEDAGEPSEGTVAQASEAWPHKAPPFNPGYEQSAEGPAPGTTAAQRSLSGRASYYNLPGNLTASGERFDGAAMTAAMTADKVPLGATVKVMLKSDPSRSIVVRVNDRGPFARGTDGKALRPLVAHPNRIIDLTPEAFRQLTGSLSSGVVDVEVVLQK
jgi:rare lipoprotein A (peptidoglycan hydrolase)